MKKLHEYVRHAAECREMERTASSPSHRAQLEEMAATWMQLADARKAQMEKLGKDMEPSEA